MKRLFVFLFAAVMLFSASSYGFSTPYRDGVLLVRFAQAGDDTARLNVLNSVLAGCTIEKSYNFVPGLSLVKLPAGTDVSTARILFNQSAGISYSEPDYRNTVSAVPNDSRFSELWGMNNTGQTGGIADADIDAPEAWNTATGSSGVIAAVIDTGIDYTHSDLSANVWVNQAEKNGSVGVDDDGNGYIDDIYGYDFVNSDGNPADDHGHGTHVSGTIGAKGNNSIGVAGVCWTVKLMALKSFDAGGIGYVSDEIESMAYAAVNGADVINASWGGYGYSQSLYDTIAILKNMGVIFVAAAGNDDNDNNGAWQHYPSSYNLDNIIAVMSSDHSDGRSSFSNYGITSVDLGAPGSNILSCVPGGGYLSVSGTSMATPHVTGACALLLSVNPSLSYSQVKSALLNTVDTTLAGYCVSNGRLNIKNAVAGVIASADTTAPLPNPAQWDIAPQATGLHTITMSAVAATDSSGVEYYFQCSDSNYNSGWQSSRTYVRGDYAEGGSYSFLVRARDTSVTQNQTAFSASTPAVITATPVDNLPPAPNPARWSMKPRKLGTTRVGMSAFVATDENGVQYYFECVSTTDPAYSATPGYFSSGWLDSYTYIRTDAALNLDTFGYTFRLKYRDKSAAQNEGGWSTTEGIGVQPPPGSVLEVPSALYPTIQSAINAANAGDTVLVHPGTYTGPGNVDLDFGLASSLPITVKSENPDSSSIVAQTIINCGGHSDSPGDPNDPNNPPVPLVSHRAFNFHSGEGNNSIVTGFTIINGYIRVDGNDGDASSLTGAENGYNSFGGAIRCAGSSPTIRNCVIDNCVAEGGRGGDGYDGDNGFGVPNGDNGGNGGHGFGGAIYCNDTSSPIIQKIAITGCRAIGGSGGDGGDGDDDTSDNGGNGGNAGDGAGGGIYLKSGSNATITGCKVITCSASTGLPGTGGNGLNVGTIGTVGSDWAGGLYLGINYTGNILRSEFLNNQTTIGGFGGGIYCDNSVIITLTDCNVNDNFAHDGGGIWYDNSGSLGLINCQVSRNAVPSDGGAIYAGVGGGFIGATVVDINNTRVEDNSAQYGGGIFLRDGALNITNGSEISGNAASADGGGIHFIDTTATMDESTLENNTGVKGGGAYWAGGSGFTITNSLIKQNHAAGGVYCSGGGLYSSNSSAILTSCTLTENDALGSGGGIFFSGPYPTGGNHAMTNCLITDNQAVLDGGGIACENAEPSINNCTVYGNSVSDTTWGAGGGLSSYDAFVDIQNSIFWNNSARYGGQIAVGDPQVLNNPMTTVVVSYSDIKGGENGVFVGTASDPWSAPWLAWDIGNISDDPLFAQASITEQFYYLSQTAAGQNADSNCVDAGGNNVSVLTAAVGFAPTTRTDYVADSGTVDMGYHYDSTADAPTYQLTISVVDSGYGTHGTVDVPWSPGVYTLTQGTVVNLHALPEANTVDPNYGYRVKAWTGSDNDAIIDVNNTVTMWSDRDVTVEFTTVWPNLITEVLNPTGTEPGTIVPSGFNVYPPNTVVNLVATPGRAGRVVKWTGDANDIYTTARTNTVVMDDDKRVYVEFYEQKYLYVPGQYPKIQDAVNAANDKDIIIINPGTYYVTEPIVIPNKAIKITSVDPADPCVVAATVIDCEYYHSPGRYVESSGKGTWAPVIFDADCDRDTVLTGITIANNTWSFGTYTSPVGAGADGYGGNSGYGGGIFIGRSSSPSIFNCIVRNCQIKETNGSGGIAGEKYDEGDTPTKDDGGRGGDGDNTYGGGIYCDVYSSPLIARTQILDCGVTAGDGGDGGAGASADSNKALPDPHGGDGGDGGRGGWAYGGGICADYGSKIELFDCNINRCFAYGGAGGDGGVGGDRYDAHFMGGPGGWGGDAGVGYGGGIYFADGAEPVIMKSIINDNIAMAGVGGDGGNGGEAYGDGGYGGSYWGEYLDLTGVGGGIYCGENTKVRLEQNCLITNNKVAGAITGIGGHHTPGTVRMQPVVPYLIKSYGAGVFFRGGSDSVIEQCTVVENEATDRSIALDPNDPNSLLVAVNRLDPYISYGGGICYIDVNSAQVIDSNLNANIATFGAGAYWSNAGTVSFEKSILKYNTAYKGGGIHCMNSENSTINDCQFRYNTASVVGSEGGAIYSASTPIEITNTEILNNTADKFGGGAYLTGGTEQQVLVENCLLSGNSAGTDGGAVECSWYANVLISNTTIADNAITGTLKDYGSGLSSDYGSMVEIVDSIIWGNTSSKGSQILVGVGNISDPLAASVDISYSDIEGYGDANMTGIYKVDGAILNIDANTTIDADPLFLSGSLGDYYLSQFAANPNDTDSPCVDTGSRDANQLGPYRTTRIDHVNDVNVMDMGYHFDVTPYKLTVVVTGQGTVDIDPNDTGNMAIFFKLYATPAAGYRVNSWTGSDNDPGWNMNTNSVTMDRDKTVIVRFELDQSRMISVPGGFPYTTIQQAIDDANNGDTIIIHPLPNGGRYVGTGFVIDKNITITGPNPDDPCIVSATVIDCTGDQGANFGGFRLVGTGQGSVILKGLTIQNSNVYNAIAGEDGVNAGDSGGAPDEFVGGGITIWGDHIVANCIVRNCTRTGANGGLSVPGALTGQAGGNGGNGGLAGGAGIYVDRGNAQILGCLIDNCHVIGGNATDGSNGGFNGNGGDGGNGGDAIGAGILVRSGTPTIKDTTVRNCTATPGIGGNGANGLGTGAGGSGGMPGRVKGVGIYINKGIDATIEGCTIENNRAIGGTAGDGGNGGSAGSGGFGGFYDPDQINAWKESVNGAGLYCATMTDINIVDCNIIGNVTESALSGVGGLYWYGGQQLPWDPQYIPSCGAGVYCSSGSQTQFSGNLIKGNIAAYYVNQYTGYGGGIYIDDANSSIFDSNMAENSASVGGGVYGNAADLTIEDTILAGNMSYNGGGLYTTKSHATVKRCEFTGNLASADAANQSGLDPYDPNDPNAVIPAEQGGGDIGYGGGLYCFTTDALIQDCLINGNTSDGSGGGVYFSGNPESPSFAVETLLKNCLIVNNTAGRDGGGVSSNWYCRPIISTCTIAYNTVTGRAFEGGYGGGFYGSYDSNTVIINSILWGNKGSDGAQIAIGNGGSLAMPARLNITYSDIQGLIEGIKAIDMIFCIDTTGSMGGPIDAVKSAATDIINRVAGFTDDFRVAVVDYKDFNDPNFSYGGINDYEYRDVSGFTRNIATTVEAIDSLTASGGADWPESVYSALMHCIDGQSLGGWREGAVRRAIIIMADAPPHDPEPFTNYTLEDVISAANAGESKNIFSVVTGGGVGNTAVTDYFNSFSEQTGGEMFEAVEADDVVDAFITTVDLLTTSSIPLYIEDGAILDWWDPNDVNNPWDPNYFRGPWDPNSHNIDEDPNFIAGYYLSQFATGQVAESNCVDGGSGYVTDANIAMAAYTTRIDGVNDVNTVDIGYHYPKEANKYKLTVRVIEDVNDPGIHGTFTPGDGWYYQGSELTLTAQPNAGYYLKAWYEANDLNINDINKTAFSYRNSIEVVMDANVALAVRFKRPKVTEVSGGSNSLRNAVNTAGNGDTLVVAAETFTGDIDLQGKEITLVGINPDDPSIVERTIINCAGSSHGFIFNNGEDSGTVIDGFTVINARTGSAIYVGSGTSPTIMNVSVRDCSVSDIRGAGLFAGMESSPTFINVDFINCSTTGVNGGGAYLDFNSTPQFTDCTFEDCSVRRGSGGGVYCAVESKPIFADCRFLSNSASSLGDRGGDGGAVYCAEDTRAEFANCIFTSNNASDVAGAVLFDYSSRILVTDCNFIANSSTDGGAIYSDYRSSGSIKRADFMYNDVSHDGGAIYITDSNEIEIDDCNVSRNLAIRGGGLYCVDSPRVRISDSKFKRNQAMQVLRTDVYYHPDPNDPNLPGDPLDPNENPADDPNVITVTVEDDDVIAQGGGMYLFNGPNTIINTEICNNLARTSGGAIYFAGGDQYLTNVRNCLFTGNQTGRDGGAISSTWYNRLLMSNCTVADNSANNYTTGDPNHVGLGGGLYCAYESDVNVMDSIFWDNQGSRAAEFYVGTGFYTYDERPASLVVRYTDVEDHYDVNDPYAVGIFVDTNCVMNYNPNTMTWSAGSFNLSDDPLFIGGSLGNYYLSQTVANPNDPNSPCLDIGSDTAANLGLDVRTTRTDSLDGISGFDPNAATGDAGQVDLGYHYPDVDDTKTYKLTVLVIGGNGRILPPWSDPNTYPVLAGMIVQLKAQPDPNYAVLEWTGTNDDETTSRINTVTMDSDKTVTVEFEYHEPEEILVPHHYATIQEAIDAAKYKDTIIVSPKAAEDGRVVPYYSTTRSGIDLQGKAITLTSEDPFDPNVVAKTIIDCQGSKTDPRRAFTFHRGEDSETIVTGFTIANGFARGPLGRSGYVEMPSTDPCEPNNVPANAGESVEGTGVGGGIYISNSSPTISYCVIKNCIVVGGVGGDGAIGANQYNEENDGQTGGDGGTGSGNGYGGAIFTDANSSPLIEYCTITDNTAGGGMGGNGGNGGNGDASAFAGGGGDGGGAYGYGYGAGIFVSQGGTPRIENCLFENNTATGGAGGQGGSVGSVGQRMEDNKTVIWPGYDGYDAGAGFGGAVCASGETRIDFKNCQINANRARGYDQDWEYDPVNYEYTYTELYGAGGGVYCDTNSVIGFIDCDFTANFIGDTYNELETGAVELYNASGPGNGGALYCAMDTEIYLINSRFIKNSNTSGTLYFDVSDYGYSYPNTEGRRDGGAIYFEPNGVAEVNSCVISGNNAYGDGGGIYNRGKKLNITDSAIGGNTALNGYGGGFYSYYPTKIAQLDISNTTITENTAKYDGGGVYWRDFNADINRCYFIGNTADRAGGLYWVGAGATTDMNDCVVKDNTALGDAAGGMWSLSSFGRIHNTIFENNRAEGQAGTGGALNIYTNSPSVFNCLFLNNYAKDKGGAVSCGIYSDPDFGNCTFAENRALNFGGALYCGRTSEATITNSVFVNSQNYAIYEVDGATDGVNVSYSHFWNASNTIYGINYYLCNVTTQTNNVFDSAQRFAAGNLGSYYLSTGGPGINGGSTTAVILGLDTRTTQVNNTPDAGMVDVGYHYQIAPAQCILTINVQAGLGQVTTSPQMPDANGFYAGTIVTLTAQPEAGYRIKAWYGISDESSTERTATIVMNCNKTVSIEFEPTDTWSATDFDTLQRAVDAAKEGDTIVLAPARYEHPGYSHGADPHLGGINIWNKNLTITGQKPDDAAYINGTEFHGVTFDIRNVGPETVLQGFSIKDMHWKAMNGRSPSQPPGASGYNGSPIRGGAMTLENASPTIVNVYFEDVSITAGHGGNGAPGGAEHPTGGNGGWGGSAYGGAVYMQNCNPTFRGVRFINCIAIGGSGGNGAPPVSGGCYGGRGGNWEWVTESDGGHDEQWWASLDPELNWDYPMDRYGNYRFGWYYDEEAGEYLSTDIYGSYDDHWLFTGMGGAVYMGGTSSPVFTDCVFTNNAAVGGYCGLGASSLCNFPWPDYHHRIESFGGAVFCEPGVAPTFEDCHFGNNYADPNVGTLNYTPYESFGGAIACGTLTPEEIAGMIKFDNCTFANNFASLGGAMWLADTYTLLGDCKFTGNDAYQGGAVQFSDVSHTILTSDFNDNTAGYIYTDPCEPNSTNRYTSITVNQTTDTITIGRPIADVLGIGGGIYCSSSPGDIGDTVFRNNFATGSGGAAYIFGELAWADANVVTVNNCLFYQNTAAVDGGALTASWNTNVDVLSSTFAENQVTGIEHTDELMDIDGYGGGLSCTYNSLMGVKNSIIWGNLASNMIGQEIAVGAFDPNGLYNIEDVSKMTVSYSNVRGGQQFAFVRPKNALWPGATLVWEQDPNNPNESTNTHGTSLDEPRFVTGFKGDHYLSSVDANEPNYPQDANSPCIDRGTGQADQLPLGRYPYTTRTDSNDDVSDIDLGFHYRKNGTFSAGDINYSSEVNNDDLFLLLSMWLQDCSFPGWCNGADLNMDGVVNFQDLAIMMTYFGAGDVEAPEPDPMMWEFRPASNSETSITMIAAKAVDNSGSAIQYKFICVYGAGNDSPGDDPCDPGWQASRTYVDTGLATGLEYGYKVKARDARGNETEWSYTGYAITGEDTTAPTPNPMTWAFKPVSGGNGYIVMTATTATDDFGGAVEYYFERYSGGTPASSGWQSGATWTDIVADPNALYGYRVKARDVKPDVADSHETAWSKVAYATLGQDLAAPVPNPMTWEVMPAGDGAGGIIMTATQAVDSANSVVTYYFECVDDSNYNSDWVTDRTYQVSGLNAALNYCFRVRARDQFDNRTAWSTTVCAVPGIDGAPPIPNPMDWNVPPIGYSNTSVLMEAAFATDSSGSAVEYYFDCVFGAGHDRTWDPNAKYLDTGLSQGLQYGYKVKARDAAGNETGWSVVGYTIAKDSYAPVPNPMDFALPPTTVDSTTIAMTALTAYDVSSVEYYFDCVTGGGHDSLWKDSPVYTDTAVGPLDPNDDPNLGYGYRVKARDKSTQQNETGWSDIYYIWKPADPNTEPNVATAAPTPNPMTWAVEPYKTYDGSGSFGYGFSMTATTATPPAGATGVEYYFECTTSGYSAFSSGWQANPLYFRNAIGNQYLCLTFRVKARPTGDSTNETAYSLSNSTCD